jgi:UTP-glucose-1-phosphate uridylyltransferase
MIKPTLVVMAAGMGSRYGGLKQIDPVGPNGEIIIDYSIYDALKAGFGKVVFIIKEERKEDFHEKIGVKIEKLVEVQYVFQKLEDLPEGFKVPEGRIKPWGTAQAVLSCRDVVNTPFAVINSDDFYGSSTFKVIHDYLVNAKDSKDFYDYSMVGFMIENTLTDNGHVARGVCTVDNEGYLKKIHERTQIEKFGDTAKYTEDNNTWIEIPDGSTVSMNTWGFTPSIFSELEGKFPEFLESSKDNPLKAEYFLPSVVDSLIAEGKAKVKVLTSKEQWYGVTYQEDKPLVKEAIRKLIENEVYPENLWEVKNEK